MPFNPLICSFSNANKNIEVLKKATKYIYIVYCPNITPIPLLMYNSRCISYLINTKSNSNRISYISGLLYKPYKDGFNEATNNILKNFQILGLIIYFYFNILSEFFLLILSLANI